MFSFGRKLSNEQLSDFARIMYNFVDQIDGYEANNIKIEAIPLNPRSFTKCEDKKFIKYVSDETLQFIKKGSIQFGTTTFYRNHENAKIRDRREGDSFFHISHEDDQMHMFMETGFNCGVFCGTKESNENAALMASRFGDNLIVINDIRGFAKAVSKKIGAVAYHIYDVNYHEYKNYVISNKIILKMKSINERAGGQMTMPLLHEMNQIFFQTFYDSAFLPSLFAKPKSFESEQERRLVFELPGDINSDTIVVNDSGLLDFIDFVQ